MKNIFKSLAMIAIGTAMLGLVACEDTDDDPIDTTETYSESASYAIIYNGDAIAAGATLEVHPTIDQVTMDFAAINILLENKTDGNLETMIKMEKLEGPDEMNKIMICYGETCKNPDCPWTSDAFTLTPGINENMAISFDYTPSKVGNKTVYRMTVGKAASLDDAQVILISISVQ